MHTSSAPCFGFSDKQKSMLKWRIPLHSYTLKYVSLQFLEYKRSWIQHVNRMPHNRIPRIMKHYSPTGRRNHGRPLKRLLDMWDRNRSTSGPTPWNDDDDEFTVPYKGIVLNVYSDSWNWLKCSYYWIVDGREHTPTLFTVLAGPMWIYMQFHSAPTKWSNAAYSYCKLSIAVPKNVHCSHTGKCSQLVFLKKSRPY